MLFKLYKYDMKSIIRQILPAWIIAPILSIVFGFACLDAEREQINSTIGTAEYFIGDNIIPMILGFALFGVFVAIAVITLLFIIQRFWKGLLGDEGYLMLTLPVKNRDHIIAKLLSALTVGALSVLDAFLSIMCLVAVFEGGLIALFDGIATILDEVQWNTGELAPYAIMFVLMIIAGIIMNIYQIYISMAIGQMVEKYRIAASVVAYFVITMIINVISSICLLAIGIRYSAGLAFEMMTNPGSVMSTMIITLVSSIILIVVFHVITEMILSKRLNLV